MSKKINNAEHRDYLIEMYRGIALDKSATRFEKLLYENAINKLNYGCVPRKVEDWVVDCEKLWRKSIKTQTYET